MKKGCTGLLRSSVGLEGPADPLVGLLGPVLGMLLGAGLSVSCVMLEERSQVSLLLVLLRDPCQTRDSGTAHGHRIF